MADRPLRYALSILGFGGTLVAVYQMLAPAMEPTHRLAHKLNWPWLHHIALPYTDEDGHSHSAYFCDACGTRTERGTQHLPRSPLGKALTLEHAENLFSRMAWQQSMDAHWRQDQAARVEALRRGNSRHRHEVQTLMEQHGVPQGQWSATTLSPELDATYRVGDASPSHGLWLL